MSYEKLKSIQEINRKIGILQEQLMKELIQLQNEDYKEEVQIDFSSSAYRNSDYGCTPKKSKEK